MLVTLLGMLILGKLVQPLNASDAMLVEPVPMVTLVKLVQP